MWFSERCVGLIGVSTIVKTVFAGKFSFDGIRLLPARRMIGKIE